MNERQILSAQEMRQLDKLTMEEKNITSFELMTQAGRTCFTYLTQANIIDMNGLVVVVAGTGNNGGDALVVAESIEELGARVEVVVCGEKEHYSSELSRQLAILENHNITIHSVTDVDSLRPLNDLFEEASTIIDGLFGIGLSRDIEGIYVDVVTRINSSYATTISIDIPSGIQANNGLVQGIAVHADHTLVIQNFKYGNLLNDALDYSGEIHLLDVGILQMMFPESQLILQREYIFKKIPPRKHNSYKYQFGNVLTIGGSKGMMGAPLLAAFSALRTGTGLSHVLYHDKYLSHINNNHPDLMVDTYSGIEDIPQITRRMSTIIFGPGLGRKDDVNLDILNYLLSTDIPLVIDADGIYYLKQLIKDYSQRPNIIITPHYKEMAEFLGITIEEVQKEPVLYARNIAHTYNLTVILKGTCTIITNNEETYFSVHGNPGLATAGTGDVLSGIVGSLLGRNMNPLEAAKIGVLLHSIAGEYARNEFGEESMIASDVTAMIHKAIEHASS